MVIGLVRLEGERDGVSDVDDPAEQWSLLQAAAAVAGGTASAHAAP
jgi:hypothetical protein